MLPIKLSSERCESKLTDSDRQILIGLGIELLIKEYFNTVPTMLLLQLVYY